MSVDDVVILIPSYEPDEKLVRLIDELVKTFSRIVVVDDGSTKGAEFFAAIEPKVTKVLHHEKNRGKGAALKTGMRWIAENEKDAIGVVTADSDGQHSPADILKIARELEKGGSGLVLGEREFSGKVPLRSVFGNTWARWTFYFMSGLMLRDTQTGLRGIPAKQLKRALGISGDRYEYEMRMLADSRNWGEMPVRIPIETIYIDDNASSHFRPVRDGIGTQIALLRWRLGIGR